ncbi:DUF6282 family protein [Sphingobium sp. YR768]|uniref:DUF6282 family protein n=1 Tax=Sphingobium sp. YR768 TaxID=1884365 RepID=UPI0008AB14F9|nr:DUF6282 family protein [Sphingobium sp. YR768]SES19241.1 hypothetical protein SAMN05518866_1586 [Sphingobium sp. YR768]
MSTQAPSPNNALIIEELLIGAVDLHCHSGPSVMPRRFDHIDALEQAAAVGMKAVLFKDHYYSVTPVTEMLNKRYAHLGVTMMSGVPLNNATGGFNRYAVDHGIRLGAQLVWMPTFSSANHIDHHNHGRTTHFPSTKDAMLAPTPLTPFGPNGELIDELKFILDLIAEADIVLSGGHLHIQEIWAVFEEAKKRGVKRFLVNHPTFVIDATLEDISNLAAFGAYIEHSLCMFTENSPFKMFEPEELKRLITAGTVDRTILGSDLGQQGNPTPVEGFRSVIALCLEIGYSTSDIKKMISTNAMALMGL